MKRPVGARIGLWLTGYTRTWLVLGIAIGVIAGLGAVVFLVLLQWTGRLLLEGVGGYTPPLASGDGGGSGSDGFARWWAIPLVVAGGALLSATLVARFAPEAQGHGTDAAIEAYHRDPRSIRVRAVVVKMLSSALTIGSGGSAGREGPTAQISAGFGSLLTRWLNLPDGMGRIAVAIGIGSGIGAIFGAPLGGAVLSATVAYREDFEFRALIPGLIASITAYGVFGSFLGYEPLFGFALRDYRFDDATHLVWFLVIGVLGGVVGLLYIRIFYGTAAVSTQLPGGRIVTPTIGGLLVGLLALAVPQVLGSGYGWVQEALDRESLLALPLWIVLTLPLLKIVATSLSIGTGGSGGIFGPGMVIGGFVGAAVWRILEPLVSSIPDSPAPFVVVGMMSCFGSAARAPLAIMVMVAEMTGGWAVLPGGMIAVAAAYLIVRSRDASIYRCQRRDRAEAAAERARQA
ncbi:chloride channel protein [Rhodococcus sp. NPDC003318]|uniref:chloride channel protein n=1 Tax=Rhodococcus sp. NPDC003318 TaxID=3364503 RepID=UPI003695200E